MPYESSVAASRPIDIPVLTNFVISLLSYSTDLIQHQRSGQALCHYTTLDGARNILSGGDLWLTNSRYSNDDEELSYGHRLVEGVFDELETDGVPRPWLQQLRDRLEKARGDEVYICCFCEKDNILSQWRGLRGDRRRGEHRVRAVRVRGNRRAGLPTRAHAALEGVLPEGAAARHREEGNRLPRLADRRRR